MNDPKTNTENISLVPGMNSVKIFKSGKYSFELDSCYKFNKNPDTNFFTIPTSINFVLNAVEAQIFVDVISTEKKLQKFKLLIRFVMF